MKLNTESMLYTSCVLNNRLIESELVHSNRKIYAVMIICDIVVMVTPNEVMSSIVW